MSDAIDPDKTRMMPDGPPSGATVPMPMAAGAAKRPPPAIPDVAIEGELGRGGMGVVYRGRQTYINRAVAIKVLSVARGGGDAEEYVNRFQREARILAGLSHPHIVGCYQAGVTADGAPYLVMEFIDGVNLQQWIREHGPLPEAQALGVCADIARALGYAQGQGIIHRDVKPENILLANQPSQGGALPFTPKLVDLGLARPNRAVGAGSGSMHVTMPGVVMGTPATMAPEQFDDPEGVDHRADIYGLGCVLYQALTGRPAFGGTSLVDIVASKAAGPPPDPRQLAPEVSTRSADLVRAMLAAKRETRPQSYQAVIDGCAAAASAGGGRRAPSLVPAIALAVIAVVAAAWWWSFGAPPARAPVTPPGAAVVPAAPPVAPTSPVTAPTTVSPAPAPAPAAPIEFADPRPLIASDYVHRLDGWESGAGWGPEDEGGEGISGNSGGNKTIKISRALDHPDLRLTGVIASGAVDPAGHFREAGFSLSLADGGSMTVKLQKIGSVDPGDPGVKLILIGKDAAGASRGQTQFWTLKTAPAEGWRFAIAVRRNSLVAEVGDAQPNPFALPASPVALEVFVTGGAVALRDLAVAYPR